MKKQILMVALKKKSYLKRFRKAEVKACQISLYPAVLQKICLSNYFELKEHQKAALKSLFDMRVNHETIAFHQQH